MEPKEDQVQEQKISLGDYLKDIPGAPTTEQIDEWKKKFGEVFCSGFSELELFIWRPISRAEFISLQVAASQAQNSGQFVLEEQLVETCVLWASESGQKALTLKAGSLPTLQEQIMQNSNFVSPSVASALVVKL